MIFRVIRDVIDAGITDIIINVNQGDRSIREAIETVDWGANFHYIEQVDPNGMMYPIVLARDIIGDDKFILHAGDNVLSGGLKKYIDEFMSSDADAHLLVTKVKNPERFGVAVVEGNRLVRTVEKPKEYISDLAMTAVYMYNSSVFKAMENVQPIDPENKGKPEYFPPPVHQWLVDNGFKVTVSEVTGWWKDTGKPKDLLLANRLVLERKEVHIQSGRLENSEVEGEVEVGEGSIVKNCRLRGPISIGRNVILEDVYIGPFTSIYDNCKLSKLELENSIVLGNVTIKNLQTRLDSCLIGYNSIVTEKEERPRTTSLFIGDDSLVEL
jgi:glucose-1-phosphate thymidylyltransferase